MKHLENGHVEIEHEDVEDTEHLSHTFNVLIGMTPRNLSFEEIERAYLNALNQWAEYRRRNP